MADSGWATFVMAAEPLWMLKGRMIAVIGGLSHSHHPSLASRDGKGMEDRSLELRSGLCGAVVQLPGAISAEVQVFYADIVQARLFAGAPRPRPLRGKPSELLRGDLSDDQTCRRCALVAPRAGLPVDRLQQERSLSDFAAW